MNEIAAKVETSLGIMNKKIDGGYADLNNKLEKLSNNIRLLEKRTTDLGQSSQAKTSTLPGKPEQNPKDFCGAIRGRKEWGEIEGYEELEGMMSDPENFEEDNEFIAEFLETWLNDGESSDYEEQWCDDEGYEMFKMDEEEGLNAGRIYNQEKSGGKGVSIDSMVISTYASIDTQHPGRKRQVSTTLSVDTEVSAIEKMMGKMHITNPRKDKPSSSTLHSRVPFPRGRMVEKKDQDEETWTRSVVKICDPGPFLIPCRLGSMRIDEALADTGANINVISETLLATLGLSDMEPHSKKIALADATTRTPKGIVRNVPIGVKGWIVPSDLVVVESMRNEPVPLVLGRPFLATVGAQIDFEGMKITFTRLGNQVYHKATTSLDYCRALYEEYEQESVGSNNVEEEIQELEGGEIVAMNLCHAVMTSEEEETDQEDMAIKYHVFTEMLEESLTNNPEQADSFYLLRKALHKVIPRLPRLKQIRRVSPLKVFLFKFFEDLDVSKRVFGDQETGTSNQQAGNRRIHLLPHQRMPDTQALDGTSLDALFIATGRGGSRFPDLNEVPINEEEQERQAYRIPTLATQATEHETTLLLKPHAFYDGSIHYRVMNRRVNSPFTYVSAKLNEEAISAEEKAELLSNPIKIILRGDRNQEMEQGYHGSNFRSAYGQR